MIIDERGNLAVASVRGGGAVKWYYKAKNSVLECKGAERGE
jgi:hypothetical protein